MSTPSLLSIVVPCYNSESTIARCLEPLTQQSASTHVEVIVVDSSTDGTPQIVRTLFPTVRLVHFEERKFAGAARNVGVKLTESPYCLMVDSDCIAEDDLIERALAWARGNQFAVIGGSLKNGTPRSISGWVSYLIEFKEFIPQAPARRVTSVPTAAALYSRESLKKAGYFDDDMWLAEDVLLNWRIHNSGGEIQFDPAMKVTHLNRTGWRQVLSYQLSLGSQSAIARRRGRLPGEVLLRHPGLIALMPFVRTINALKWLLKCDAGLFFFFLFISPMYFLAACFWSVGFFGEAGRDMVE